MVFMNIDALRRAEGAAGQRNGLEGMKTRFAEIASDRAMFGQVPNADKAAAALQAAARAMLQELERAGMGVEDIRRSAAAAANIGRGSDEAARTVLSKAQAENVGLFNRRMGPLIPKMPGKPGE